MERILVIRFGSLGDLVLLSALLTALRARHPRARITLATKARYAELYRNDSRVDGIAALADGPSRGALAALAAQLEPVTFDRIIDAHNTLRSRVLTWWLPPAPTARLPKDTWARLLFLKTRVRTRGLQLHMIDRYLSLIDDPGARQAGAQAAPQPGAQASALPGPAWRAALYLDDVDRRAADAVCRLQADVLAVAPGSRHQPKRWPAGRYADLLARFQRAGLGQVLLVGGPGEEVVCAEVAAALPQRPAVACGALGLRTTAALLARCRIMVCNDSGLMHMAEAVGTPVLALFGPTSRELGYFPGDSRSRVIEHALPCRPCSRNGARPCHMPEQWCMTRSTVDLVYSRLELQWRQVCATPRAASI
jgi:heptosyltransferase-2